MQVTQQNRIALGISFNGQNSESVGSLQVSVMYSDANPA